MISTPYELRRCRRHAKRSAYLTPHTNEPSERSNPSCALLGEGNQPYARWEGWLKKQMLWAMPEICRRGPGTVEGWGVAMCQGFRRTGLPVAKAGLSARKTDTALHISQVSLGHYSGLMPMTRATVLRSRMTPKGSRSVL